MSVSLSQFVKNLLAAVSISLKRGQRVRLWVQHGRREGSRLDHWMAVINSTASSTSMLYQKKRRMLDVLPKGQLLPPRCHDHVHGALARAVCFDLALIWLMRCEPSLCGCVVTGDVCG